MVATSGSQNGVDAHDSAGVASNAAGLRGDGFTFVAQYIDEDTYLQAQQTSGAITEPGTQPPPQDASPPDGYYADANHSPNEYYPPNAAYNSANNPDITSSDVAADARAGLNIVSIFETAAMSSSFYNGAPSGTTAPNGASTTENYSWESYLTQNQGYADAQEAYASARSLGQPFGTAIYFAMDFDPADTGSSTFTEANALAAIDTYMRGVNAFMGAQTGGTYQVGLYGAGDALQSVSNAGLAAYTWLSESTGWAGYSDQGPAAAASPGTHGWTMIQSASPYASTNTTPVSVDYDMTANGSFGAWVTCFCPGTRVRTARGEVAVEALRVGDLAVTASGRLRPVTWTGHRALDGHGRILPHDQQPVRVRAGAFGPGLPTRDLFLSPGHPVLVDADADGAGGVLVPVMCLINGTTVARVPTKQVTYWHVELDQHDILLAEGLPAESFLDYGNRGWFSEGAEHALLNPDHVAPGLGARCRPVATDGPRIEAERRRLDQVFAAALDAQCAWPRVDEVFALG